MQPPPSLWWSSLDQPVVARRPLEQHLDVDVAIVGGGYTGLWTARELLRRDATLRIAVIEQSLCGFGASGRNGGWASALYPVSDDAVVARYGQGEFAHLRKTLQRAVIELGAAADLDGINADYVRGGSLTLARSELQVQRLEGAVEHSRTLGVSEADFSWLDASAARERIAISEVRGATFTPHCARIHPARLVRGLAASVEHLGAHVFENTRVTRIVPGRKGRRPEVLTVGASVHADVVVRATEGYTPTLPRSRRDLVPIYSLMVASEPQSDEFWADVGLANYETFSDGRHLLIYGQRTEDNRIAFGGRGAPYHFGSTVEPRFDHNAKVFALLEATLHELFPSLAGSVTHRWGGPLAMPRDHSPSVVVDLGTGLASAGGYTGDGVVLSHVCATALADLLTAPEQDTDHTRLPFVQHPRRRWEFEPLRWLGINAGLSLATWSDHHERRWGSESRANVLLERLMS